MRRGGATACVLTELGPITFSSYMLSSRLNRLAFLTGAGAEGEVYAAWWRDSMVAVKRFNRASDSIHELRMHTAVGTGGHDENIVPLRGYCRRDDAVYLVMEYCPRCEFEAALKTL